MLWVPALLLLLDRHPDAHAPCPRAPRRHQGPLWSRAARFFGGRYATWLGRRRRLIVALGVALLLAELLFARRIAPPTGPIAAVPPSHNQARYVRQELRMSSDLGKLDLRVVLGLEPLDARDGAWRDGGQVP